MHSVGNSVGCDIIQPREFALLLNIVLKKLYF